MEAAAAIRLEASATRSAHRPLEDSEDTSKETKSSGVFDTEEDVKKVEAELA